MSGGTDETPLAEPSSAYDKALALYASQRFCELRRETSTNSKQELKTYRQQRLKKVPLKLACLGEIAHPCARSGQCPRLFLVLWIAEINAWAPPLRSLQRQGRDKQPGGKRPRRGQDKLDMV